MIRRKSTFRARRRKMSKSKRIGIMGGTFDPIHIGHLILGENAYIQFHLDKVLFMPSGNPAYKPLRGADNQQRVEMVRRAIGDNPHFELSLQEMHDEGYTYTRQTLETLTSENPDTEYFFIMGADSLLTFDTWKDPERISELCTLVVAVRDHLPGEELDGAIRKISEKFHAHIEKLSTLNIDISSSQLRSWLREGRSCRYYIPDRELQYIQDSRIYETV